MNRALSAAMVVIAGCGGADAQTDAQTDAVTTEQVTMGTADEPTMAGTSSEGPTSGEPTTTGGLPACGEFSVVDSAAWPEADALFHKDPRWLGADDAYSVDLGGGRVLWLFADTFIATSDAHVRGESKIVRNSVAIQSGTDPASADIDFFWQEGEAPSSFFPEEEGLWFWPGDGERVGEGLLLFLMAVRAVEGGFGFEVAGSDAIWISDADAPPDTWQPVTVASFRDEGRVPGSGSVLLAGEDIVAFSDLEDEGATVLRWPATAAGSQLPAPEVLQPSPALTGTQVEFTVHHDAARDLYVHVQSEGFGGTDLAYRTASALTGPWSEPTVFHRPEESDLVNAFVYAGKAHPELTGADLVVTYVANSFEFADLFDNPALYYPRFVRVTLGCG